MILLQASPMESALDGLLATMIQDSGQFIAFGQAVGCLGAIFYVFYRVWGHMARNEPIDVFPLFRPAALGLLLLFYTQLATALVFFGTTLDEATGTLLTDRRAEVERLNTIKDQELSNKRSQIIFDVDGDGELSWRDMAMGPQAALGAVATNAMQYGLSKYIDEAIMWIGETLYDCASLVLKFLQTFFLLILIIVGPLTFGLSCFDWFYSALPAWFSRLIHLLLWAPIGNILAGVLEEIHIVMLNTDIQQIRNTPADQFSSVEFGMIAFYVMGIMGYFMVPKVASWILESAGVGNATATAAKPLTAAAGAATIAGGAALGGSIGGGAGMVQGAAMASRI